MSDCGVAEVADMASGVCGLRDGAARVGDWVGVGAGDRTVALASKALGAGGLASTGLPAATGAVRAIGRGFGSGTAAVVPNAEPAIAREATRPTPITSPQAKAPERSPQISRPVERPADRRADARTDSVTLGLDGESWFRTQGITRGLL
jgi:hypothetical protein